MTKWGGRHGHLALVLLDTEYQTVTGTPQVTTERVTAPPIVPEALANNATLTSRTRVMADHNLACQEFWLQEAVDAIIVDRIVREVIHVAYIDELEDDYVGYNTQSIKSILLHLRSEWCIITTLEQKQAADDFRVIWDLTSHITKFARRLLPSQQTLAEYTTSLEGELLGKLDPQHTILFAQNSKFLEMLAANSTRTGTPATTASAATSNRQRTRDKKPSVGPPFCNSCKKDKCFHEDDDCFALEKNATKRPAW
eukprot:CCRYP_000382-RA/>CCRYP_000382-RA protein AED:0.66 eAED:0.41 QI:0/0/0/0.33/1/1/3/0/253